MVRAVDLGNDPRWPVFGPRAVAETGIAAACCRTGWSSTRTTSSSAGLNLYAARTAAFGHTAEVIGTLVATHGALAVIGASNRGLFSSSNTPW